MLSGPRAGKAAGQGSRGRGNRSRSNSPLPSTQGSQQASGAGARGSQSGPGRARGGRGRATVSTNTRRGGREASTWARGGAKSIVAGGGFGAGGQASSKAKGQEQRQPAFAFTGERAWRAPENTIKKDYKSKIQTLWETLKRDRVVERQNAIRDGKISDPEKKVKLSEAVKSVGTCQEMCPEWERITRIHDGNVLWPEKIRLESGDRVPCEEKMVKRFQRSAAGDDAQLPSDLRPPKVLHKTLEYMIDKVLSGPDPIERVQEFLWDRSRAIRNDFSIQQVTNLDDVRTAIDCFERIARYHILALHQTSHSDHKPGVEHKQENEQLTNTLTSLFQYYEDNRGKIDCENEPEFRAYYIIREIEQERRPDLESRVQQWPMWVIKHPRVRTALRLYAAAGDVTSDLGPLDPKQAITVAQANGTRFWSVVSSAAVPYLMACCAETYFRIIRDTALTTIWKSCRRPSKSKLDDLLLSDITDALGFDNEEQAQQYCEQQGFVVAEREDGNAFLDLTSVPASHQYLPGSDGGANQVYSERLVEDKRHGRLSAAIVRGLSVAEARTQGLLEESDGTEMDADVGMNQTTGPSHIQPAKNSAAAATASASTTNNVFGSSMSTPATNSSQTNSPANPFANPFTKPPQSSTTQPSNLFNIEQPSTSDSTNPFQMPKPPTMTFPPSSTPLSNEQIAAKVFSTPSQSLTATKLGDSNATGSQQTSSAAKSGLFDPDSTIPNPFGSNKALTNQESPLFQPSGTSPDRPPVQPDKPQQPSTSSIFEKPPIQGGLGTSLFSKPLESQENSNAGTLFGQKTTSAASNAQASKAESPSLFIPFDSPAPEANAEKAKEPSSLLFPGPSKSPPSQENKQPDFKTQNSSDIKSLFSTSPPKQNSTGHLFLGSKSPFPKTSTSNDPKPPAPFPTSNPFASHETSSLAKNSINEAPKPPNPLFPVAQGQAPATSPSIQVTPPAGKVETQSKEIRQPPSDFIEGSVTGSSTVQPPPSQESVPPTARPPPINAVPGGVAKPQRPSDDQYLTRLVRAFALGPNGMIQQFIENEVSETVRTCIRKVNREREKEEIVLARKFLLSCKYMRRWRDIAWNRKLRRNAKQRRQEFRKSMQEMALSSRNSSRAPSVSITTDRPQQPSRPSSKGRDMSMGPPPKSILKNGLGTSLPAQQDPPRLAEPKTFGGSLDKFKGRSTIRTSKMPGQRRSDALASINASKVAKSTGYRGLSTSMIGDAGLRSEQRMKEASRLVDGRTDTTRTDYFKLKALGIDPNTPVIPQTRKRRSDEEIEAEARKSRYSPAKLGSSISTAGSPPVNGLSSTTANNALSSSTNLNIPRVSRSSRADDDDDDDEALFAQIRAVKDALSETESWYREYREQSERTSVDISNETEKQRRLREWKPSVSRTEARRKREGLPSFLRSSWTPRETVSVERAESRLEDVQGSQKRVKREQDQDQDQDEDEDEYMYEEDVEAGENEDVIEDDVDGDEEQYDDDQKDQEDDDEEEEERGDEGLYEEDYDDENDTQAFGGYEDDGGFVNPHSAFATQGASVDDAIEL